MHLQLYAVTVPAHTTRRYLVPKYDIPIIKAMWRSELERESKKTFGDGMPRVVEVSATGLIDKRNYHSERERIRQFEYTSVPDGAKGPPHEAIYPSDESLFAAYEAAVREANGILEERARFEAANPPPPAPTTLTAADIRAATAEQEAAELRKKVAAMEARLEALVSQVQAGAAQAGAKQKPRPADPAT